jgi:hypothetical protein
MQVSASPQVGFDGKIKQKPAFFRDDDHAAEKND